MLVPVTSEEAFKPQHANVAKGRGVVQRQAAVLVGLAEELPADGFATRRPERKHLFSHLDHLAARLRILDAVAAREQRATNVVQ